MVVRQITYVDDERDAVSTTKTVGQVSVVNNVRTSLPVTKVISGIVLPVIGKNIVQNAVVSDTPPANPYEGQIWIDIS